MNIRKLFDEDDAVRYIRCFDALPIALRGLFFSISFLFYISLFLILPLFSLRKLSFVLVYKKNVCFVSEALIS
jgi:hypothetical protein